MFKKMKSAVLIGSLLLVCLIAVPFSTVSKAASTPQPVQVTKTLAPGNSSSGIVPLFSVPSGKRLIIETITVRAALPVGEEPDLSELLTNTGSNGAGVGLVIHEMLVLRQGLDLAGRGVFVGTHPIRAYSEPGTFVFFQFGRSGNSSGAEVIVSLSGTLVDA